MHGGLGTKQAGERLNALRGWLVQVLDHEHAGVVVCVLVVHLPQGRLWSQLTVPIPRSRRDTSYNSTGTRACMPTVLYSTTAKLSLLFEIMCAFVTSRATVRATSANAVFAVYIPYA